MNLTLSSEFRVGLFKLYALKAAAPLTRPFTPSIQRRLHRRSAEMSRHKEKLAALLRFEALLPELGPDCLCLDLGANVGKVSKLMAATGAQVHAFEPDPWSFGQLTDRFGSTPNVTLHNAAVGERTGTVYVQRAPLFEQNPTAHSVGSFVSETSNDSTIAVEQIDLFDFLKGCDRPIKILKMDIEGSEVPILERLFDDPVLSRIEHLFVETHEQRSEEIAKRTAALRRALPKRDFGTLTLDWI